MAEYGRVALTVIGGIPGNEIGVVIDMPCDGRLEARAKNEFPCQIQQVTLFIGKHLHKRQESRFGH